MDKYTYPDMQNEIIKTMALQVLCQVIESISSNPFLSLMVDETTDISNKEQLVMCIRWVNKRFQPHEEFIGLYHVESTQSSTLVSTIHDQGRRNVFTNGLAKLDHEDNAIKCVGGRQLNEY